jgi:cell division topological specificity factor
VSRIIPPTAGASATVARARLESLLEHDRNLVNHTDLLAVLREEISALLRRHAVINPNSVHFMEVRGATASTLSVDIEVPFGVRSSHTRYCV